MKNEMPARTADTMSDWRNMKSINLEINLSEDFDGVSIENSIYIIENLIESIPVLQRHHWESECYLMKTYLIKLHYIWLEEIGQLQFNMIDKSEDKDLIAWAERRKKKIVEQKEISREIIFSRLWFCPDCGFTKMISYERLAESGSPYCDKCSELSKTIEMILTQQNVGEIESIITTRRANV